MQQQFGVNERHPQASLLNFLHGRALRHMGPGEWRDIVDRSWQQPILVQNVAAATVLCVECPSWGVDPNLAADIKVLARALGGYVDPWAGAEALVLLQGPDEALELAMELRNLAPRIRLHVGMATGACGVASIQAAGQKTHVIVGEIAEHAAAACELAPAGTFRMCVRTFERLRDDANYLDQCVLQTEYEGEDVAAISATPPPLKGGEQFSSFAGLGLM